MTQKRKPIVLPPNILDFVYSGGDVRRHEDSMTSRLLNLTQSFASYSTRQEADVLRSADSIEAATIDMEIRIAGARLVQSAYYIAAGKLALATTSFETAKQLFENAHARAQENSGLVRVEETGILQALSVVGYQLMQATEAAKSGPPAGKVAR